MIFLLFVSKKIIAILGCQVKRDAQGRRAEMMDNTWYMCYVSLQLFSSHITSFSECSRGKATGNLKTFCHVFLPNTALSGLSWQWHSKSMPIGGSPSCLILSLPWEGLLPFRGIFCPAHCTESMLGASEQAGNLLVPGSISNEVVVIWCQVWGKWTQDKICCAPVTGLEERVTSGKLLV